MIGEIGDPKKRFSTDCLSQQISSLVVGIHRLCPFDLNDEGSFRVECVGLD